MKNYAAIWKKEANFLQFPYEEFVTEFPNANSLLMMEKVDGMLGALVYQKGKKTFVQTTRAHEIVEVPAINEIEIMLEKNNIDKAIIVGELVAKVRGVILPFNETMSVVKTFHRPQNKDLIHYYPFDIYDLSGRKPTLKMALQFLARNIKKSGLPHVHLPEMAVGDLETFRSFYQDVQGKQGFDGIVIRNFGGKNYKVKFTNTADVVIIGAGEEGLPAWGRMQVSYLITSFIDKNGKFRTSSKIGTGFTASQRSKFYEYIQKNKWYEDGGKTFVRPKLIVEVKYFRHRITNTPILHLTKEGYKSMGMEKSITFSHPSFVRVREDKKANKIDVRLEQLPDWEY